ncbi:MAG: hypothetical protein LQ349_002383 [Xanthoria aureola]|nr:MAG: hypothetical protein LQ349_002383 [Xanthoria aureola]
MSTLSRHAEDRELVYWPKHLLPQTLPEARVFAYGYDTRVRHALGAPVSKNNVYDIASDFLRTLEAERRSQPSRPLIFIAHSLGGIVVKELLRQSRGHQVHHSHLHHIYKATAAVLFFGTPHGGADPRGLCEHVVEQVARAAGLTVNEQIVSTLLPNSERLRELRDEFGPMARREQWIIYSFQEQYGVQYLGGKKVVEDVSSCLGDPSLEITQHIASDHMDMCRFSGVQDPEYRKVIGALDLIGARMSEKLVGIEPSSATQRLTRSQRQPKLEAMWFRAIDARYETIKAAHAKTCKWLLQRTEYQDWLNVAKISTHHGLFWIKGKPGSGKSTLLKFAVQSIRKVMRSAVVICFFFNARGENLEKSTLGMYRSLLSQLLRALPDIQEILDHFTPVKNGNQIEWHIERLRSLFAAAIQRLGERHLICFIDALDESDEDQIRDLVVFLEELGRPTASSPINFRVCLSSRHYPHISISNGIEMTLEGQEGHDQDISKFLSSELKAGGGTVLEAIKDEILSRASGVFLWVALVVQILNKEYDHGRVHALRKRLKEIPDGLDKLFEDILTRDNAHFEELILCLQWILYAKRPLKREELYYAILSGIDEEALTPWDPEMVTAQDIDKFILSCSKGLAETTKSKSQTVQFIHESVRDFLLEKNGINKLRSELDFGRSHERLKQCCYSYMKIDVSADLNDNIELPKASTPEAKDLRTRISIKFPFLEFAVHHVLFHADHAARHGISQDFFLQHFATEQWIFLDNLFERYQVRRRPNDGTSNLPLISAQKDLAGLIRNCRRIDLAGLIRNCGRIFHTNGLPCNLDLLAAALFDFKANEDTIRALLLPIGLSETSKNAMQKVVELWPNFFASKITGFLVWAASCGHDDVLRSLLDINAITPNTYNRKDTSGRTMLLLAASNGHHAVVKLLVLNLANSQIRDKDRIVPLTWAASAGHTAVVELLIENRDTASLNSRKKYENAPLLLAASAGHEAVVRLLLKAAGGLCNPDVRDSYGRTPLSMAAENGHMAVVRLLLKEFGGLFNPDDRDNSLSLAVLRGHGAVVKLLLENSATVNNRHDSQITPLMLAAAQGNQAVVKLLLQNGVEIDSRDSLESTPLLYAATRGNQAVFKLLLENGAKVNIQDTIRRTPLIRAAIIGNQAAVKLLLENAASLNIRDVNGQTAISYAVSRGHDAVVELLRSHAKERNEVLDYGVSSDAKDPQQSTT